MANVRDFYMRDENDPQFRADQIEVYDDVEACISQIRMTLLTRKGEVLGEPNFGLNLEGYLFDFELDPFGLSDEAQAQISLYVPESKKRRVSVTPSYTLDERERKLYVLKFTIDGRRNPYAILYDH